MKTTVRIFAMTLVLAGLSTSSFSRPATQSVANRPAPFASTSGLSSMPIPWCGPYICPPQPPPSVAVR